MDTNEENNKIRLHKIVILFICVHLCFHSSLQSLRCYWYFTNKRTRSIEHRGGNRRSPAIHRQFAYSLRAEWSVRILLLDYDRLHLGRVERSRNDVVRQPIVDDSSVVPNQLFKQTVANGLQRASFDLARCEHWMYRAADVLGRGDLGAGYFVGVHVDF